MNGCPLLSSCAGALYYRYAGDSGPNLLTQANGKFARKPTFPVMPRSSAFWSVAVHEREHCECRLSVIPFPIADIRRRTAPDKAWDEAAIRR